MRTYKGCSDDRMVDRMAGMLHDEWRRGRLKAGTHGQPDAVYKSCMKPSGLDDGREIDIAQAHDSLAPKWQAENREAAAIAIWLVRREMSQGTGLDEMRSGSGLERLAADVHEAWMQRNPRADYNAAQHVPYASLPEAEKQKDRDQVLIAVDLIQSAS